MRCSGCDGHGRGDTGSESGVYPRFVDCKTCNGVGLKPPDFEVFVPGVPRPQGSKTRNANGSMRESSKYVKAWRQSVVAEFMPVLLDVGDEQRIKPPLEGPLVLGVEFLFQRPNKHWVRCQWCNKRKTGACPLVHRYDGKILRPTAPVYFTGAPDLDKLHRAIQDSLEAAGVCRNDSQFVRYHVSVKRYANPGEQPGAQIRVWRLT